MGRESSYEQERDAYRSANSFLDHFEFPDLNEQFAGAACSPDATSQQRLNEPKDSSTTNSTPPYKRQRIDFAQRLLRGIEDSNICPGEVDELEETCKPGRIEQIVNDIFDCKVDERGNVEGYAEGAQWLSTSAPPELVESIELYVTRKSIGPNNVPVDRLVAALFKNRDNVWVNKSSRPTALEMWDRREE